MMYDTMCALRFLVTHSVRFLLGGLGSLGLADVFFENYAV